MNGWQESAARDMEDDAVAMAKQGYRVVASGQYGIPLLGMTYATAYAAVASLVSRQEEVQSAIAPIGILQIAGYLLVYAALLESEWPLGYGVLAAAAVRPHRHGGADGGHRRAVLARRPGGSANRGIHWWPDLARRPHLQQRRAPPRRAGALHGCVPWVTLVGRYSMFRPYRAAAIGGGIRCRLV